MKILISSHAFAPSIGGIETVSELLACEFARAGHKVVVVTQTGSGGRDEFPFRVLRRPSLGELSRALFATDIYWQNNLSLRTLWPAWLLRRPVVITHQGSYCRRAHGLDLGQRLKRAVVRRSTSVAISRAVADSFAQPSRVIPNPFDARLFAFGAATTERPNDFIFVGRLVREKGLDLLLPALEQIPAAGLTIVGMGPELEATRKLAGDLGLSERVQFAGAQRGPELAATLQRHKILVVPSRYEEPFGVVALEGIASGCALLGSSGGGLPEAIGPCGLTFPNGDARALARLMERLLQQPNEREKLRAAASGHLARFHPAVVAVQYLELFQSRLT